MTAVASPSRILIMGAGKSGTSALFYCVAESAERHHGRKFGRLFEPKTQDGLEALAGTHAVAKVLGERFTTFPSRGDAIASFGRRIMIVRDPRDTVVSRLLWLVATRIGEADPAAAAIFLEALGRKERQPSSHSLLDLYRLAAPVAGFGPDYAAKARDLAYLPLSILERHQDFFVLKYESFVDRDMAAAEAYLGFPLIGKFMLPPKAERILRTGQQGGWADWFLEEDEAFFARNEAGRLIKLGYDEGRPRAASGQIDPVEGTGYIARVQDSIARHGK